MLWTHDLSLITDIGRLLYALKELIKSGGGVVLGSGDGGSIFSTSADVITHNGSGANGFSNNGAWWQGRLPGGLYVSLQRSTSSGNNCAILISDGAPFTGGSPSATRRMPSVDELTSNVGGGTDASPTFTAWFTSNANFRYHIGVETVTSKNLLKVLEYDTTGSQPVSSGLVIEDGLATLEGDPSSLAIISAANPWTLAAWDVSQKAWFRKGLAGAGWVQAFPLFLRGGTGPDDHLPQVLPVNPFNGLSGIYPMPIGRRASYTDPDHFKGIYETVFWLGNDLGTDNRPFTLNVAGVSRSHIAIGNFVHKWDGSTPAGEAGNVDAEILGLVAPTPEPAAIVIPPPVIGIGSGGFGMEAD